MKLRFNTKLVALALMAAVAVGGVNAAPGNKEYKEADELVSKAGVFVGGLQHALKSGDVKVKEVFAASIKMKADQDAQAKKIEDAFEALKKTDSSVTAKSEKVKWVSDKLVKSSDSDAESVTDMLDKATGASKLAELAIQYINDAQGRADQFNKGVADGGTQAGRAGRSYVQIVKDAMWNDRSTLGKVCTVAGSATVATVLLAAAKSYSEHGTVAKTFDVLGQWFSDIKDGLMGNPEGRGFDANVTRGVVGAVAVAAALGGGYYWYSNRETNDTPETTS